MSASNCPETPRQKMIQMMYLVYTAMLALNVSAEVVEGFKTVGNAMNKSNENLEVKLVDTYDNFAFALENNPEKVKDNYDKAQEIKKLSNELTYTIDTVIYSFVGKLEKEAKITLPDPNDSTKTKKRTIKLHNADGTKNFDSIAYAIKLGGYSWIQKLDNNHEGTRYFLGKAEGAEATEGAAVDVKNKILDFKKRVREILGEDAKHVSLGLAVEETYFNKEGERRSWEQLNFNNTVAGAAIVTLVRMKAETMNAEFDAVNQLYKQIRSNDYSFDKTFVIARPTSSYIMKGGTYELTVNVGAYDSKAHFDATIGGNKSQSNDTGAVVYKTVCNTTGPKTLTGIVYVKKDDGVTPYEFKQSYYVADPMAVFDLAEMNVVYKGIDNPVSISVPGTPAHDVIVQTDPNVAEIVHAKKIADGTDRRGEPKFKYLQDKTGDDGIYIIRPKHGTGLVKVNVFIKDGKGQMPMGTKTFRVRLIPKPIILLGGKESGMIPIGTLRNVEGISFRYSDDFPYHLKVPVATSLTVDIPKVQGVGEIQSKKGNSFDPEAKEYIKKARPGYKINISAKVKLADGREEIVDGTFRVSK